MEKLYTNADQSADNKQIEPKSDFQSILKSKVEFYQELKLKGLLFSLKSKAKQQMLF
jgi:hypothetical protein